MQRTTIAISSFSLVFLVSFCLFVEDVQAQTATTPNTKNAALENQLTLKLNEPTDVSLNLDTSTGLLSGSLMMPVQAGKTGADMSPLPIVIIHAGSGPTDRDGNSALAPGKNDSLKMLAIGLAQNGIASLRYDKRGVAKSAAAAVAEENLRFDNYVDDLASWVKKLRTDNRFSYITIAGHSEGSLIGMIAAANAKADGFISIAGIARSGGDVLRTQLKPKLPDSLWQESERTLMSLEAGKTVSDPPAALAALYRPSVQPYLISWLSKRPMTEIAKLTVPILILQGTTDIQVAVSEAELLKRAAPKSELVILTGMNHVLKSVEVDPIKNIASYSDPILPLHAELVSRVVKFVKALK